MSRTLRAAVLVALAAVVVSVPACGDKNKGGPARITVGVVTNCTAEFWSLAEAGANKAAKEFDVDLQFRQPEKAFDASVQMPIVEAWAKQGVSGIAVSVIDPQGQTPDLTRIAKKVPLLTMDNDADQTGRLCYIGIDNYEAGKAAGRIVKKLYPNGGTVGVFIGSTKSANGKARTQGVLDELAGAKDANGGDLVPHPTKPDVKVKKYGKYFLIDGEAKEDNAPTNAGATAAAVLARVDGVADLCMVGLYAYNPPAILDEAKKKGMAARVKIVGFDEDTVTLKAIAAGEIEATIVQDPFMYGYKSVEALAKNARGDKSGLMKEPIAYRVITKTGGADETVNGVVVKNLKAEDFEKKLKDDLASVQKK